jgi:hypothetical protein
MRALLCLGLALVCAPLAAATNLNWLNNGDFAGHTAWQGDYGLDPGRQGGHSAAVSSAAQGDDTLSQSVALGATPPASVEVSGWVRCQGVKPGAQDWEQARIAVTFHDAQGGQVGGWPVDVIRAQGDSPWRFASHIYAMPKGAAQVKVKAELANCSGQAWFDHLELAALDYDDQPLPRGASAHPGRALAPEERRANGLLNPGFEQPSLGGWEGAVVSRPGRKSRHALMMESEQEAWKLAGQSVHWDKALAPAFVDFGGWAKAEGVVPGREGYMLARMTLVFKGADGQQVGGWPEALASLTGDQDWTHYSRRYPVPADAVEARVEAGLSHCAGRAWFDDLSLVQVDAQGHTILSRVVAQRRTDTKGWYAFQPASDTAATTIDLSFLLDAPAGKHGFAQVDSDGELRFADGARARFWGVNLVAGNAFPSHADAEALALRLSRLGVNLVRLHHLDAPWADPGLIDKSKSDSRHFDAESRDRLDYLMAQLEKRGIYIYHDLLVHRQFKQGDGLPEASKLELGAKGVAQFSDKVIALEQEYALAVLGHVNPYTKRALKDDPALVGMELVNESSLFTGFGRQDFPPAYEAELQRQFEAWGGKGPITRFGFDWDQRNLKIFEHPENSEASLRFMAWREDRAYQGLRAFLRKNGVRALITGSNIGLPVLLEWAANARMDFMDTHAYWDHPQVWKMAGGWSEIDSAPFDDLSMLRHPFDFNALPLRLADWKAQAKPLIVTEWNDCFPNRWRLEGPLLMAVYGSLQAWDGALQFDYAGNHQGAGRMQPFDIGSRPDNEAAFQMAALIWHQGMVAPAEAQVVEEVDETMLLAQGSRSRLLGDQPWLPYVARVGKRLVQGDARPADLSRARPYYDPNNQVIRSAGGGAVLEYGAGRLSFRGPQLAGLLGDLAGATRQSSYLSATVQAGQDWAALVAASLDDIPLDQTRRVLLLALAHAENSGQTYNADCTALRSAGEGPVLMQGLNAQVDLQLGLVQGHWVLRPLKSDGRPGEPLKMDWQAGHARFHLSAQDQASSYLLAVEEGRP